MSLSSALSLDIAFLTASIIICISTIFSTSTLSSTIFSAKCPSLFKDKKRASGFFCPPALNTFHVLFPSSKLYISPHWLSPFVHCHKCSILFHFKSSKMKGTCSSFKCIKLYWIIFWKLNNYEAYWKKDYTKYSDFHLLNIIFHFQSSIFYS